MEQPKRTGFYALPVLLWFLGPCSSDDESAPVGSPAPIEDSPNVEVLAPSENTSLRPGGSVVVRYVTTGLSSVNVLADIDGMPGTTGDQIVIASDRPGEDDVEQTVTWNTSSVAPGKTYRILVAASEGGNVSTAPGRITLNAAPSVRFVQPVNHAEIAAGGSVTVRYVADDPDDVAFTRVVADVDGNIATTGDQIELESARPEANGVEQVTTWNTATAPNGTYSFLASCSDILGGSPIAVAAGRLTVFRLETVRDDFENGVIDTARWEVKKQFPASSANEAGGQLRMSGRPYVVTVDDWRPTATRQLTIDLSFLVTDETNELTIVTRSDAESAGAFAEARNGIVVEFAPSADAIRVFQVVNGSGGAPNDVAFTFAANTIYRVRVFDDGSVVRVFVGNLDTPVVESVHSTSFAENRITFFNLHLPFGITALTDVAITGARNT